MVIALALCMQLARFLSHDVAYLTWVADRVAGGAVYGRDITELNPPLAFLIYAPAAFIAKLIGFDLSIKLWIVALAASSLVLVGHAAPAEHRLPVVAVLGLYFALAFPWDFGQREQIALLLCAPYVAGHISNRPAAIASGLMAGVGFCIKPHYLIALALLVLFRRKLRTEEKTIALAGLIYAAVILVFFRTYLLKIVFGKVGIYWSVGPQENYAVRIEIIFTVLALSAAICIFSRDRRSIGFFLAALGFFLAALTQGKYFQYHFIPAWGFLMAFLASQTFDPSRPVRLSAGIVFLLTAVLLGLWSAPWLTARHDRYELVPSLVAEIDRSDSFSVIAVHPYPAFPTAIYAARPYVGIATSNGALPPVGMIVTGQVHRPLKPVEKVALSHALTELGHKPGLVIVDSDWIRHTALKSRTFDGLEWLKSDPNFSRLWRNYAQAGQIGRFKLFRYCGNGARCSQETTLRR